MRKSIALLLAATSVPALAQEQQIVVTAAGLKDPLGDVAYNVVTIDQEALAREPSGRLENILGQVAGFQLFRASDARSGHPTGQGATLRGLGGNASSRALLVLDGVPQSDPFGGWISWPGFDTQALGRIRVTRGGGSGVYGPGALAGTIELESRSVENFQPARANLAYGNRDASEFSAGIMLPPTENSLIDISGHYGRGDGFVPVIASQRGPIDEPAAYKSYGGTVRYSAPIGNAEIQLAGRFFEDERNRGFPMSDNRTRGFDTSVRLLGRGSWQWEGLFYYQDRNFRSSFASVDDARTTATQVLDQFSVPARGFGARFEIRPPIPGDAVELRLGGDYRETVGRTRERFFFVAGAPTREREAGGTTRTTGAFADATVRAADALTFTGSARLDRWWIDNGFFRQGDLGGPLNDETLYPDRDGWRFTGRAGLAWRPDNPLTIRAAGYTGWRLPTLNELYRAFRVGDDVTGANAALRPEDLQGIEAGIDYTPASFLRLSGTLFYNRLDDAIANVTVGQGPGFFPGIGFVPGVASQRQNLDGIAAAGIELDAQAQFAQWSLRLSYAFTDAEVDASGLAAALNGLRPAQVARHNGSATLSYMRAMGGEAAVTVRYIGARFEDDLNQQRLDDALTVGARALVPIYGPFQAELRVENIFDARVEAAISGAGLVERGAPRSVWAGLRFAFF
ncbi:TonB-dependent receptor [Parasphingopyxis marina]|uniref:TonB-dependent receptor n=1 Tax=Parasphingopyxis marina TaxID=2761622 RepID=A0A842HSL0_9SPHN|nr:TonB-dependent receptor [Parasphingopyxis marina]MBC2776066.1 TonB-dependent receptor [Parasphingopyxis marina]